jgi:hypothetical protein
MKQYLGISRDHSGSMSSLRDPAMKDYNDTIKAARQAAKDNDIHTLVSVTEAGGIVRIREQGINIDHVVSLHSYGAAGGTPLFDSVGQLINDFKQVRDSNDPDVTFLIIVITDGEENTSWDWDGGRLSKEIKKLQATDRWTFVFRVPRGYKSNLERFGIPSGNIQEWDQTEQGLRESSVQTVSAVSNYYSGVKRGVTSTRTFFTNLDTVASNDVAAVMTDISKEVLIYPIYLRTQIEAFAASKGQLTYEKGKWFYQMMKPEAAVQDYKVIVVRNKNTGLVYEGRAARQLLNIPTVGTIRLRPGDHGDWDIFIQSTSLNRILLPGTSVLYWKNA